MKKVLAIAPYPYLPFFSGGQKFIALFLAHLATRTDLTVISVPGTNAALATNYRVLPMLKPGFSRYMDLSLVSKISEEVKNGGYQTVIWEHPYYAWLAVKVRKKTGVPFIIHTHNIEYQRFRSTGRWWWPVLKVYERWAFRKADHVLFITPEDKSFAINKWNIAANKCTDLPFGIDISAFPNDRAECKKQLKQRHGISDNTGIILFNGLLDYKPNLDALLAILNKINPLLLSNAAITYKIIVCGNKLPASMNNLQDYKDKNIIFAGFVEDIDTYFKGADLFLNPVQSGGGIKTKMVEAIGFGTTVIATKTGAEGIRPEICGPKLVTVADNEWIIFAKEIENHLNDETITPSSFYSYYNWNSLVDRLMNSGAI